ncbi:hypothetical protein NG2371_01227 [Nocardia gamkensis]|nr:hypothetical protein [Nocardia gamkensis]
MRFTALGAGYDARRVEREGAADRRRAEFPGYVPGSQLWNRRLSSTSQGTATAWVGTTSIAAEPR